MLNAYTSFFKKLKSKKILDYELVIVINNTRDRTEEVVRALQKKNKEIRILNFERGGKGFAITQGFLDALKRDSEFIGFVDADLATSPEAFYELVKPIRS